MIILRADVVKNTDCLDEEKECLTNPAGNGYHGTVNRAISGRACMYWTDVDNYTISASLNVDDTSQVENYCRRVPFTTWNGPSCVTVDDIGMVRLERCDVPYCGNIFFYTVILYAVDNNSEERSRFLSPSFLRPLFFDHAGIC